ncbi:MAG: alpha-glucan family phosphorylase [Planctomycetaceae bacterium]|nr:alpha-glucan family phosphorylase [Planctomycetaceae bacterium]
MWADVEIAYFSMEIAIAPEIPTYAGGLGILAGDTIRSAADLSVPMVAVSLVHRDGYLTQQLDAEGWQSEASVEWPIETEMEELSTRVEVSIEGRPVKIRAWKRDVVGVGNAVVSVLLLDTDLPENSEWDKHLTDKLYGGDDRYRLCQEVVLGIGGLRVLRALGCDKLRIFHLNEGHAALLTLGLLDEELERSGSEELTMDHVRKVHQKCVFTTHTPVAAGHDQFPMEVVQRVLGRPEMLAMKEVFCCEGLLNMTFLAMNLSRYINGVAKRHGETSQHLFAHYKIDSITNGVHAATWAAPSFQKLFDDHIPDWRSDNFNFRYAIGISTEALWEAHQAEKQQMLQFVKGLTSREFSSDLFTIGFARRATAYKRPELLLHDLDRLKHIGREHGTIQVIFAGKAHPRDDEGKKLIHQVVELADQLHPEILISWVPNYDMQLAKHLVAGCDLWLNTPKPPLEASGTSGMKAAINGVPSLSIPDGWWLEGCIEGVTGWSIGEDARIPELRKDGIRDATSLYEQLDQIILPLFHNQRDAYVNVMRHCIALNGSFFNTQRMMQQYVQKAYFS